MKIVKLKDYRKRPPDPREQMRLAIMELVREAQAGHKQEQDNRWLMRSARFIGASASRIHRIFARRWLKILLAIAGLYLVLRWAGISVRIYHGTDILFIIK